MANPLLEFDPTSEDAANSPLEIWNTISYAVSAFSAPAPPLTVQWASSVDTEGSLPSSKKHENRTISITVDVLSAVALRSLQAKIGKVTREGGTLKLTLPASSEVVVFDLHSADTFEPQLDIVYFVNSGAFCTVNLSLTAKPYGRGPEVTLTSHSETTLPALVFTETAIKGDWYGLGRLVVTEAQAQPQSYLVWGVQSRYYSAASTARLYYEAEAGTLGSGVLAAGPAGASGAGSNTVFDGSLNSASYRTQFTIGDGTSTPSATHIGTFRVFVRAWAPATNTGTVSVRLDWQVGTNAVSLVTDNTAASISPFDEGFWVLLDLGQVSIPKVKRGTQAWAGRVQATSTVTGDDIYTDYVLLVPVTEGTGEANGSLIALFASKSMEIRYDDVIHERATNDWAKVSKYEGDYLLVPPAGLEARTTRFIVKADRATLGAGAVTGIDDISAQLFYTPRYLVVPEP